jgi:hypothetical protein
MTDQPKDLSGFIPEGWEGKLPPCLIQVNEQGELYHQGAPIIHPAVRELIFQSVHFEDGIYLLKVDGQTCQLEVADTFHVVVSVKVEGEVATLTLNDGEAETLDASTLEVGGADVLYCRVKAGAYPARFARAAYYSLAEMVEPDGGGFCLVLGSKRYPIAMPRGSRD